MVVYDEVNLWFVEKLMTDTIKDRRLYVYGLALIYMFSKYPLRRSLNPSWNSDVPSRLLTPSFFRSFLLTRSPLNLVSGQDPF